MEKPEQAKGVGECCKLRKKKKGTKNQLLCKNVFLLWFGEFGNFYIFSTKHSRKKK